MQRTTIQHHGHDFTFTDHEMRLPAAAVAQLQEMLTRSHSVFPHEDTFVRREYGMPALLARFDGVWDGNVFRSYEIQGGCGWVGFAGIVNQEFKAARERLAQLWPPFPLLIGDEVVHDDDLWLPTISLGDALSSEGPLMIRYPLGTLPLAQQKSLIARSVRSINTHLDKKYGVALGWWTVTSWDDRDKLPWHEAFVVKPVRGFGSTDVMCWIPDSRRGRSTKTQILDALDRYKWLVLQPFIPPNTAEFDGTEYNVIYRPFFGFDPEKEKWTPMHGVWTARPAPNLRIHGASDAISGPLIMEK